MKKWLPTLEKKMETFSSGCHDDFRLFMSAEPAETAETHIIPQGILESSIKITNEPPTGMLVNNFTYLFYFVSYFHLSLQKIPKRAKSFRISVSHPIIRIIYNRLLFLSVIHSYYNNDSFSHRISRELGSHCSIFS